jgi:membrane protein implicated in regulation of membrane protease activity
MVSWIIWLVLAAVLGVAELMTVTLTLGLLAAAAAAAAVAGAFGVPVPFQILAFVVAAGAGLGLIRPIAVRHLKQPPPLRTGTAALVGRSAVVLQEVNGRGGRVRIGGEEWSSRSYDETLVIPAGTTVDVIEIEGVTALVYPRE